MAGAYMVWHLRGRPLYVGTREIPFWHLDAEVAAAAADPAVHRDLIADYGARAALLPLPTPVRAADGTWADAVAVVLPPADWAVVHIDTTSPVALRREPAHGAILARDAYRVLRPGLPANAYPTGGGRTPADDARFVLEVARCRAAAPDSVLCMVAQAAWWRVAAASTHLGAARALLDCARAQVDRWGPTPQDAALAAERRALQELGP